MKNLKRLFSAYYELPELKGTSSFCVNSEECMDSFNKSGPLYCYNDGYVYSVSSGKTGGTTVICDLKNYYGISGDSRDNLGCVKLEYQYVTKSLVIALVNGDVFSLELDSSDLQCIGSVDSGLKAMEWSPDFETVVFATGQNTIILMSGTFDPINEINLCDTGPGIKQMVNVGWGKKETQFHGSEGKAARINTFIEGAKDILDDRSTRISWRGDSTLFVVSFWLKADERRHIKIFNQEGILQCDGEILAGTEQCVAWRPSGNLIALSQKLPNKHVVSFMEKNGLIHGSFVLPSETEVKELCWNIDSTILCVVCKNKLLLYTVGNYYWYLKQQLDFNSSDVPSVRWDTNCVNLLHVFESNGLYSVHQWSWSISRTLSLTDDDGSLVGVIDGCKILLSSFKKKIIPPPLSDHTIIFTDPVCEIVFAPGCLTANRETPFANLQLVGCNVNNFMVYLSSKKVALVSCTNDGPQISFESPIENLEVSCLHFFTWISPEIILCCGTKAEGQYYICELKIDSDVISAARYTPLEQPIISLVSFSSLRLEAMLQLVNGKLFKYTVGGELTKMNINLLEPCCEFSVYNDYVVALSELKRLYFNGELITSKATSFFILPPFVLVTTSEHLLLIYKVNNLKCEQVSTRRLERGSRIVTVVQDNIILQLPRGNLETIQPRALTLHTAASLINKCEYRKLFNLFRKHRINMNLIVDHQPQTFLLNVTRFVQQINDPLDMSLFLSELSDVDVTRGIYKEFYKQENRPLLLDKKVERVCQALRGVMITSGTDKTHYLNPIITTYVKTNDMNEALNFASQSPSCLKHLLFLVDVDKLYDYALSFYNLEMALKIAEKSKKDPKEYVPYLNSLQKMDIDYMKYTIDCQFKKYESALKNISKSTNEEHFKEALSLIENHKLYPQALQSYKSSPGKYNQVTLLFAEHLLGKHAYEEAALMFTRCGRHEESLNAYIDAGLWKNALIIARNMRLGSDEIQSLGKRILPVLIRKGSWSEAALLCQEILKDDNLVIEYLVQGKLWDKVFYHASLVPGISMDSSVMPYVKEEAVSILEIMKENQEKLKKYSTRLMEVRLEKMKKKDNPITDIDISDIQSDISSVSSYSGNTSRTAGTQSSKNTRKMQKKMWSLKEGNPREEFALLSVITQTIQDLEKLTDDVSKSCLALLYFNDNDFDNLALNLQTSMKQTLKIVQEIKNSVWPPGHNESDLSTANELQDAQLKFPPTSCIKPGWNFRVLDVS